MASEVVVIESAPTTLALLVAPVKPLEDAVIVTAPALIPLTAGNVAGVVAWKAMKTLEGVMVAIEVSLLCRSIVTPLTGAGDARLTNRGADWPTAVVTFAGNTMVPSRPTVRLAVPLVYRGAVAVMVVTPVVTPVAVNDPVVLPPGIVTVTGCKVTTPPGEADRATDRLGEGAGKLSVIVPLAARVTPIFEVSKLSVMVAAATFTTALPG